ncbi:hypothetical protein K458DRAFT_417120 [Lentithecium fluviatile CBS 122367]|uniref:Uncharacterized protein n=1 Tax=Lentithecium fluviatile CBS 122367 TaxID=1168545 RepID=A0A6G1J5Z5_9PLEO|nr:hypothetical protein K458DRAFT_417120 [Lentithecium fluviatile CBS 122367]
MPTPTPSPSPSPHIHPLPTATPLTPPPADARALYSMHGLQRPTLTFDVITSTYGGAYQATLIYYHTQGTTSIWTPLHEGMRCKDMPTAMKYLWDAIQTCLGDTKGAFC